MTNTQPSIVERCRAWIYKSVPAHSRAEYDALLHCNEDLMVRLISKCIAYEELLKAHHALEEKVYETMPSAPFKVRADMSRNVQFMDTVATIEWRMDPLRACTRVSDLESFRGRVDAREIAHAMRNHFTREVAPKLWEQSEACLHRAAAVR